MLKKIYNGFFFLCSLMMSAHSFAMEGDSSIERYNAPGDVKAIALVVHGFNTKPETMKEVIDSFNAEGITCLLAKLSGHRGDDGQNMTSENWLKDWKLAFAETQKTAKKAGLRFFVVGHSMGCLVNSCHMADTDNLEGLAGCIYFAPADGLNDGLKMLLSFADDMDENSQMRGLGEKFSGSNAAQIHIPICGFKALNNLLLISDNSNYAKVSTLVLTDPKDLLIGFAQVQSLIETQALDNSWQMVPLTSADPLYAHMCISSGHPGFSELKEHIKIFVSKCLASEETFKPGSLKEKPVGNNNNLIKEQLKGCAQQ